jgi:hypothetical protein
VQVHGINGIRKAFIMPFARGKAVRLAGVGDGDMGQQVQ